MFIVCFLQNIVKFEISAKFINLFFLLDLKTGMGSELVKVYKSTFHMMACLYFSLKIGQNLVLTPSQKQNMKLTPWHYFITLQDSVKCTQSTFSIEESTF